MIKNLPTCPPESGPDRARFPWLDLMIVECRDDIVCIRDRHHSGQISDIILWNPTTSEIKDLRHSSYNTECTCEQSIGFGFDPQIND
ncbi:unnamed protein product [Linum trigynum]|uniref:Uncharacterized protein n=1 Tax=Linum trigynum TaxID=586398 RepID=A0AAV2FV18_9ROSI